MTVEVTFPPTGVAVVDVRSTAPVQIEAVLAPAPATVSVGATVINYGGDVQVFNATAGVAINAGRAVRLSGGSLYLPDAADVSHAEQIVGVAETAGSPGDTVRVRAAGQTVNPDWSWSIGPVYVAADGVLTQTPSGGAWLLPIGRALAPTVLLVDIEPAIYRS